MVRSLPALLLFSAALGLKATTIAVIPSVLPIPAAGPWSIELRLYNPTPSVVVQEYGHATFIRPPFPTRVEVATVLVSPGQTVRLQHLEQYYDPGFYLLEVGPGLDASEWLQAGDVAAFGVKALTKEFTSPGDSGYARRLATDPGLGIFLVIASRISQPLGRAEVQAVGPDGSTVGSWLVDAVGPVTMVQIPAQLPQGGSLRLCHTACSIGQPGRGDFFAFVVNGPPSGKTQDPRYFD